MTGWHDPRCIWRDPIRAHRGRRGFERSPCIGRSAPRRITIAAGKSARRSFSVRPFTRAHIASPPVPIEADLKVLRVHVPTRPARDERGRAPR
jgi:hypothetical protein